MQLSYLKEVLKFCFLYYKAKLKDKIRTAIFKAVIAFKETLWKEIKSTVQEQALMALKAAEKYCNAEQVKVKKEEIISQIVDKIKLPFILKPFKKLMKNFLNKKVEEIITDALKKGQLFLAE